jgi:threonylcarbamoyladenosine tRNA methylthiotransferase MtaB
VLKEMMRPYDRSAWIKRVEAIKAAGPDATIGADVIVGFPGETDEHFDQTRSLAESGLIDYLHVFSYSDREGTPSSRKTDKVHSKVIRERARELTELSARLKAESYQRQVGRVLEVIPQHQRDGDGCLTGIAGNYTKVELPRSVESGRSIVKITVTNACQEYVEGELVAS